MTEQEAIEVIKNNFPKTCKMVNGRYQGGFDDTEGDFGKALLLSISALEEIHQYRALGSVQFIKDSLSNYEYLIQSQRLNAESDIKELNEYRALGTVEEVKRAMKYLRLAKKHGTTGQAIDFCAEYEELGTVEELREAMEKQRAKKPQLYGDFEDGKMLCPNCEEDLMDLIGCGFNNCPYCGQSIDWSEEND